MLDTEPFLYYNIVIRSDNAVYSPNGVQLVFTLEEVIL